MSDAESLSSYEALSLRRRQFVDAYLGPANGCKAAAARSAGYENPAQEGYRLYRHPEVRAAIDEILRERGLSAPEIVARLSEQARAAYAEFLRDDGTVDLEGLRAAGLLRLVKGTTWDRNGKLTVEFHDAQGALVHLGKHLALFTERVETEVRISGFEEWTDEELEEYARTGQRPQRHGASQSSGGPGASSG